MDSAAFRFGCEMMKSVSDRVRLRHFSGTNIQQGAEEMSLMLWRERRNKVGDLEDLRTRWYLKPLLWKKSPRRVRGTPGSIFWMPAKIGYRKRNV